MVDIAGMDSPRLFQIAALKAMIGKALVEQDDREVMEAVIGSEMEVQLGFFEQIVSESFQALLNQERMAAAVTLKEACNHMQKIASQSANPIMPGFLNAGEEAILNLAGDLQIMRDSIYVISHLPSAHAR